MSYAKPEDRRAFMRKWSKRNKDKIRHYQLSHRYGISKAKYDALFLEQKGGCALCGMSQKRPLFVDHCHITKAVRGLLCIKCNTTVGYYERIKTDIFQLEEYTRRVLC